MSERGSFVTEYIYCGKCFEHAKTILLDRSKGLCSTSIPSLEDGKELPIIAGKLGGSYQGEEIHIIDSLRDKLEIGLCHKIRIAILCDDGSIGYEVMEAKCFAL